MALFVWSDAIAVGVQDIDSQHKQLFQYMNELHEAMLTGKTDQTPRILRSLLDYTVSHFGMEERLMERHPYPDVAVHKAAHAGFIEEIKRAQRDMETKALTATITLSKFLKDWLVNHIQQIDKKFAAHLKTHGIK